MGKEENVADSLNYLTAIFLKNERYGIVGLSVRSEKAVSDTQTHGGGISPSEITDARTKMCSESNTHYTVS